MEADVAEADRQMYMKDGDDVYNNVETGYRVKQSFSRRPSRRSRFHSGWAPGRRHCFHSCLRHDFFFFQAEDGIRDRTVTGVQTCALPISSASPTMTIVLAEIARI